MHVLKCYDIFENRECKVVVLEYCNFGSLADEILKKRSKHISESQAVRILKSIISALKVRKKGFRTCIRRLADSIRILRRGT